MYALLESCPQGERRLGNKGCPCCASNSQTPPHPRVKGSSFNLTSTFSQQARPPEAPPPRHRTKIVAHNPCIFICCPHTSLLGDLHRPLACGLRDTAVRRTDCCSRVQQGKLFGSRRPSWTGGQTLPFFFYSSSATPPITPIYSTNNLRIKLSFCQNHHRQLSRSRPSRSTPATTRNTR